MFSISSQTSGLRASLNHLPPQTFDLSDFGVTNSPLLITVHLQPGSLLSMREIERRFRLRTLGVSVIIAPRDEGYDIALQSSGDVEEDRRHHRGEYGGESRSRHIFGSVRVFSVGNGRVSRACAEVVDVDTRQRVQ